MYTTHPFHYEKSKKVYDVCKNEIQKKECYMNVFLTLQHFSKAFQKGEFRVAYGYMQILTDANLYARHAFIVDKEGHAVDPTVLLLSHFSQEETRIYHAFHIFDSADEYLDWVLENDNTPDLIRPFRKKEQRIIQEAFKEGMVFLG